MAKSTTTKFGSWTLTTKDCGFSYEDTIVWTGPVPAQFASVAKDSLLLVVILWEVDHQVVLHAEDVSHYDADEGEEPGKESTLADEFTDVPTWEPNLLRAAALAFAAKFGLGEFDNLAAAVDASLKAAE